MGKRADQKVSTRTRLLAHAEALFTARGYDAVGMRDVAAAAGVSTGAIFANFAGKDELWEAAMRRKPPLDRIRALLRAIADGAGGVGPAEASALLGDIDGAAA